MEQEIREALEKATPRPWKWDLNKQHPEGGRSRVVQGLSHWDTTAKGKRSGTIILDVRQNRYGIEVITCGNESDIKLIENGPTYLEWCLSQIAELRKENEWLKRLLPDEDETFKARYEWVPGVKD